MCGQSVQYKSICCEPAIAQYEEEGHHFRSGDVTDALLVHVRTATLLTERQKAQPEELRACEDFRSMDPRRRPAIRSDSDFAIRLVRVPRRLSLLPYPAMTDPYAARTPAGPVILTLTHHHNSRSRRATHPQTTAAPAQPPPPHAANAAPNPPSVGPAACLPAP